MGQSPKGSSYNEDHIGKILVQGNADLKYGYVRPRIWTTQVTKEAEPGDIIMSVRAPAGEVGKTNYHVVLGRGVAAIKGNEFIYQLLYKMNLEGYWKKYSTGSTFASLNSNIIFNAKILLPKSQEQEEIGDYLTKIDSLITLHQRKPKINKKESKNEFKFYKRKFIQRLFLLLD